jgi:hypothetical protein
MAFCLSFGSLNYPRAFPSRDEPPHPVPTALELGESTALSSLSSDEGGGEGRGEESRFYWISPLPARSSQGEGDRRSAFQCLIQWQCTPSLSHNWGRGSPRDE